MGMAGLSRGHIIGFFYFNFFLFTLNFFWQGPRAVV